MGSVASACTRDDDSRVCVAECNSSTLEIEEALILYFLQNERIVYRRLTVIQGIYSVCLCPPPLPPFLLLLPPFSITSKV